MLKTTPEAVDMEDYNRWDRGLPLKKKTEAKIPDPEPPKIENRLPPIKPKDVVEVFEVKKEPVRNLDGVISIGYHVSLKIVGEKDKLPVNLSGWMPEVDYLGFRRLLFRGGKVNVDNMIF